MRVRGKPVSCCFTGHRPAKLPWGTDEGDERCLRLKARLREVIARAVEDGYTHFICGMAEGCDLYCAEAVLALRERHSEVTLEAAIPCPTQADGWSATAGFWSSATMRRWCRNATRASVCSGATATWSTIPTCSSLCTTACPAARATPSNTPCAAA